jgi:hypothetical protein
MPRRTPGVEVSFLWLWRPTLRSVRAQDLQVVAMAWAVASRGYPVRLVVEGRGTKADLLAWHGLPDLPNLAVDVAPSVLVSLVHRARIAAFTLSRGRRVAVCRSPRLARFLRGVDPGGTEIVYDVHEVAFDARDLETIRGCDWLIANSPGTAARIAAYTGRQDVVAGQNGTSGCRRWSSSGVGAVYAGSLRAFKDADVLADAARIAGPIDVIGDDGRSALGAQMASRAGGMLRFLGPMSPSETRRRLGGYGVGLLPVAPGEYGDALASPLKLWDYLDAGLRVVAADVPAVRAAWATSGSAQAGPPPPFLGYQAGDPGSLAEAIARARRAPRPDPWTRSWGDRADELLALLGVEGAAAVARR